MEFSEQGIAVVVTSRQALNLQIDVIVETANVSFFFFLIVAKRITLNPPVVSNFSTHNASKSLTVLAHAYYQPMSVVWV